MKIPIISSLISKSKEKQDLKNYSKGGLWYFEFTDEEKEYFLKTCPKQFWTNDFVQAIYYVDKNSYVDMINDLKKIENLKKKKLKEIKP